MSLSPINTQVPHSPAAHLPFRALQNNFNQLLEQGKRLRVIGQV
jgi:RNase P protein component